MIKEVIVFVPILNFLWKKFKSWVNDVPEVYGFGADLEFPPEGANENEVKLYKEEKEFWNNLSFSQRFRLRIRD